MSIACVGVTAITLWHAHALAYSPDGLPTWDSAGYLLEAERVRALIVAGNATGLIGQLARPDLHPPLHALVLGVWMSVLGPSLAAARAYPVAAFIAGWFGVVALGKLAGTRVGVLAATMFTLGLTSLDLLCTPMTESTALWAELLALGVAMRFRSRTDVWSGTMVGLGVLSAGMVRYNLWPMLLAPMGVDLALTLLAKRRLVGPSHMLKGARSIVLWTAPTLLLLATWQYARPELASNIEKFLENRSSGIPFWTIENLAWVPIQTTKEFFGTWLVTGPLLGLFGLGLVRHLARLWRSGGSPADAPPVDEPLDLLRIFVLVSFAALTAHDFKVVRNLHTVLPLFLLCALHELDLLAALATQSLQATARTRLVRASASVLGGSGLLCWVAWQNLAVLPALTKRADFTPDPTVLQALEFIEHHARASKRTWVTGWVFRISPNLIDWWLRTHGVPGQVKLDQPLLGEQTRIGVDSSWKPAYAEWVSTNLLTAALLPETTYITLQTAPGTRYADDWKAFGNNYARAFAEQTTVPEVDRVSFIDRGLIVRAYRLGGKPSSATLASLPHPPDEVDNSSVRLPLSEPLQRDTMHGLAPAWRLYPAKAATAPENAITVERGRSTLAVHIPSPVPDLQLCSDIAPSPGSGTDSRTGHFRAVINLSTAGLTGKAWIHIRGMDASGKLVQRGSAGPDITMAGPLRDGGAQVYEKDVALDPAAVNFRTCIVLGEAAGAVTLDDVALYPPGTPAVPDRSARPALELPSSLTSPHAGTRLPSGPVLLSEGFDEGSAGWRLVPSEAPGVTLTHGDGELVVAIARPLPKLQVCGPPFPLQIQTDLGLNAAVDAGALVAATAVTGHGFFFHWRALDSGGKLVADAPGVPGIQMTGPQRGDGVLYSLVHLAFPAGSVQVRPCVVLDDTAGEVSVQGLAVYGAEPP